MKLDIPLFFQNTYLVSIKSVSLHKISVKILIYEMYGR
jgi:hypothetical protein